MSSTLILFYTIFLSQIFLVSIYFPGKIRGRIRYVLKNFPPKDYPKLYPKPHDYNAEEEGAKGLVIYRNINLFIAAIGLGILAWGLLSGYTPNPLGGDEIFVLMYFMLQMSPMFYLEIRGLKQYKRMREAAAKDKRKAELNPRHLFDFISPFIVVLAGLLYVGLMGFFIYDAGFESPWEWEVYVILGGITGMNVLFIGTIAKFMFGKKLNPHQAHKDRLKQIETIVKACFLTSIAASLFIIVSELADKYAFELYDPVLMSLYLQLILFLSLGTELKKLNVQKQDFDVYKEDKPAVSI